MATIDFNKNEVNATISSLTEEYDSLDNKFKEMNQKKDELTSFWDATEAETFKNQLENVSAMFEKFQNKYESFLTFLNSVVNSYSEDEEKFISSINSVAKESK